MNLSARHRKVWLIVHVAVSVGWIGAVAAYLVLDVSDLIRQDAQTLRAAYLAMEMITWWALVPLALATLATGLIMSLGTQWGLVRHYWVLISFLLTLLAVAVLLVETQTISQHASVAADPGTSPEELRSLGTTLVHSGGGIAVLLVVFVLNMVKPRGLTRYGWRKQREQRGPPPRKGE